MNQLEAKVAVVTGGASGIGRAIAATLVASGARVVVTDVQQEAGESTAKEIGATFRRHDVRDESQWSAVIQEVEQRAGQLSILINNAGIVGAADAMSIETTRLADWRSVFAVNVEGVFLGCRAALPALRRAGGGVIINISSVAAFMSMPEGVAYGASKAAVAHLSRSVALYCLRDGSNIRCNSVHPGNVKTPLLERTIEEVAKGRGVPLTRVEEEFKSDGGQRDFLKPEDVARAVRFLVSDDAAHITGSQLVVDGGSTLVIG